MSAWEQEEWLAYELQRERALDHIREALIKQEKYTIEAFVALALARM